MQDKDVWIKLTSINAMGKLGAIEYAAEIADFLNHNNIEICLTAMRSLTQLNAREYSKNIAELLDNFFITIVAEAIYSLTMLDAKEYTQKISGFLKHNNSWLKLRAIDALESFQSKEYVNEIANLMNNKNSFVRRKAIITLGILGAKEYADNIATFLELRGNNETDDYPDFEIIGAAVQALGNLRNKDYLSQISELSHINYPMIRTCAGLALALTDPKQFEKTLRELLNEETLPCWIKKVNGIIYIQVEPLFPITIECPNYKELRKGWIQKPAGEIIETILEK